MNSFTTTPAADLPQRIVLSISSDIGTALAAAWLREGLAVAGTYRTPSVSVEALKAKGAMLVHCDLADRNSVDRAIRELHAAMPAWDVLVVAPGTQEPVGLFLDCAFDQWSGSLDVNFTAQLRMVHGLMPARRIRSERGPMVLMFAGGGTNNATTRYSAYTISKIASIKMMELLDAEVPDTRFAILGPGWVKTKIHEATLAAGAERAGDNFERTRRILDSDGCVPLDRVVECCEWLIGAPRQSIGGRNISLVYDLWGSSELLDCLAADADMYKLRRHGNDRMVRDAQQVAVPGAAEQLAAVMAALPQLHRLHAPDTPVYRALSMAARNAAMSLFGPNSRGAQPLGPFGALSFPYRKMGAIDSIDLFGLDELILFAFYWANRARYRRVVDIGANIGLHSIVMARCGFAVRAFEPDPVHLDRLRANLSLNGVTEVEVAEAAVSDRAGSAEFVRVKGNTTGSHLAGAKAAPYGPLDRFPVALRSFADAVADADFVKIDAEGHEAVILHALPPERWKTLDAVVEIGTPENARALFEHFQALPVGLFAQKIGWERVRTVDDMPASHRDGSLCVTREAEMPWGTPC